MVFESLVVDLVNRFLGDYIDNLDKSQLSLGLWGGRFATRKSVSAIRAVEKPLLLIGNIHFKVIWRFVVVLSNTPLGSTVDCSTGLLLYGGSPYEALGLG